MQWLKRLFAIKTVDFFALHRNGAIIIDVRTPVEFNMGKIHGSKNIPLNNLGKSLEKLKLQQKTCIFCCASGMRSAQATTIARQYGIEAYNGGGWRSLNRKL